MLLAGVLSLALLASLTPVYSAFSATTAASGSLTASALFPLYPNLVLGDSPYAYLRGDDAQSAAGTSGAADSRVVAPAHSGTYDGRTDGVSTWWPGDEGSGTKIYDKSGAANTGTLGSGVSWGAGRDAGSDALSFDGSANAYVTGSAPAIHTNDDFTAMAWVHMDDPAAGSAGASLRPVLSQIDGSGVIGFLLKYQPSIDRWQLYMGGIASSSWAGAFAATNHVWTHVAVTYTHSTGAMKVYVNGAITGPGATYTNAPDVQGTLREGEQNGFHFIGMIQDARVYQQALSATQILAAYGNGRVSQWNFEENTGTATATSATPGAGAYTGTLTGAGAGWTAGGHTGNAVNFTGGTGYITTSATQIRTDDAFSVSAWVKPSSLPGAASAVSFNGTNNYAATLRINAANKWAFAMSTQDVSGGYTIDEASSTAAATTGSWVHLVAVYDGRSAMYLYVNGGTAYTASHRMRWNATNAPQIGRTLSGSYQNYWYGAIDDLRIYARALTATDVNALYTGGDAAVGPGTVPSPYTTQISGALQGAEQGVVQPALPASNSVAFRGVSNTYLTSTLINPNPFTIECWFKADDISGGGLIGFTNGPAGSNGSNEDRHIYLDSGGKITFGVWNGSSFTNLRSPGTYDDGGWHYVAASIGAAGEKLYLDGSLVGSNSALTTSANNVTGYWRFGGTSLAGVLNRPANDFFTGTLDEMAVYQTQLSDQQISWRYHSNH